MDIIYTQIILLVVCIICHMQMHTAYLTSIFKRNIITLAVDVNSVPLSLKNTKMFK